MELGDHQVWMGPSMERDCHGMLCPVRGGDLPIPLAPTCLRNGVGAYGLRACMCGADGQCVCVRSVLRQSAARQQPGHTSVCAEVWPLPRARYASPPPLPDVDGHECSICMAAAVTIRFHPCYHCICCSRCAARSHPALGFLQPLSHGVGGWRSWGQRRRRGRWGA